MFSPVAVFLLAMVLGEIFVLAQVGSFLGVPETILLLVLLSGFGVFALRRQGVGFLRSTLSQISSGSSDVADQLANQAILLFACLLLVLPGLLSAAIAILLFAPPVRSLLRPVVQSRVQKWTLPYQRFGRTVVDVDGTVVDVDSTVKNDYPPVQRELG